MKNSIMNVTYHYSNISIVLLVGISVAFMLPTYLLTIFPFGIDGNIDEKNLIPRITKKDCSSTNPLHQSFSSIDIPQCALYQNVFHAIFSPIDINVKGFNNQNLCIKLYNN